ERGGRDSGRGRGSWAPLPKPPLEVAAGGHEAHDEVERAAQLPADRHAVGQLAEQRVEAVGRVAVRGGEAGLEAELPRQRRAAVAGRAHTVARSASPAMTFDSWLPCHASGHLSSSSPSN